MSNKELLQLAKNPDLRWFDPKNPEDEKEFRRLITNPNRPKKPDNSLD